jgi:lysophospholipase L1-like esterase
MKFLDRRGLINGLLVFSVLLNVGIIGYLAQSGGLRRIFLKMDLVEPPKTRLDFQKEMEARYRKLPNSSAEIVFAGDSLIADGPWAELFSEVRNRGIGGETTSGFLNRLDEITEAQPRQVFLLIGTNDLAAAVPEAQVLRNYRAILERLHKESPKSAVNVIGLLPVNPSLSGRATQTNAEITSVNRRLKELVGQFPGDRFIDLSPILADSSGQLRPEFSTDGIHLNLDGYLAIRKSIEISDAR